MERGEPRGGGGGSLTQSRGGQHEADGGCLEEE